MKQLEDMLLDGHWRKARDRAVNMYAGNPDTSGEVIESFVGGLHRALDAFRVPPVEEVCRDMDLELPEPFVKPIQETVVPRLERIGEWKALLNAVTEERLARELQARAVIGDVKAAAGYGCELLERAAGEDDLRGHCRQVAAALVELYTNKDRAVAIIKLIASAGGVGTKAAPMLAEIYQGLVGQIHQTALQSNNQAWVRNQNEAVLAFRSSLPGANEAGEPEPEQVERFRREVNALLNAAFYHHRPTDLIDALTVLHEYCPADPLPAGKRGIAETREKMFNRLGPRARLVAVRALASLGESPQLVKAVLKIAGSDNGGVRIEVIGAVMGGLRHADFFPYLRSHLEKARTEREEEFAVDALGRINNPAAVDLLLDRLDRVVRKINDPAYERRAHALVRAVGRAVRVRGFDPARRMKIVDKVIASVDRAHDRHLSFHAASDMFSVRLSELRPDQKNWAAARTVECLWAMPPGVPVALGYGLQDWRAPMAEVLDRLGEDTLPVIIESATKFATQLSGAMGSLADVLSRMGDVRAVPLLEMMARTILLQRQEEESKNPLLEEKVFDAASGLFQEIDRDDLLHTILYALKKTGGQQGLAIILHIADEVQAGRLSVPGDQTAELLVDTRIKQGGAMSVPQAAVKGSTVDRKALKKALGEAKGGLFTKTPARIAAIARLGSMRDLEAVPLLMKLMGEKDPMLAGAAHTALGQYFRPVPVEAEFGAILDVMLADTVRLKGVTLERFLEFIRRELPKRPPYDRLIARQIEAHVEDPALAHRLRGAAIAPEVSESRSRPPEDETAQEKDQAIASARTVLDQRREYMLARKAWIDGGKIGPPPSPPDSA